MDIQSIAKKIISLKEKDESLRNELIRKGELSNGYNKEMVALHNSNAKELNQIIEHIGFPTPEKVGEEASEAAWLIIQHSIGQPDFMKKAAKLLEEAISHNKVAPKGFAYLTDRIAVLEGRHQLYGTQFDWDENGEMNPQPYDNIVKVNQRRKAVNLNTLEEQIEIMQQRVITENQRPPKDFEERKQASNEWRKAVGWIK